MSGGGGGDVKVVVRFRPQQERELRQGGGEICQFDSTGRGVAMNGQRRAAFTFDRVFRPGSTQAEVYDYAAKPIVEDVLKGYNGTIFAYGQTSSGKTHTMQGPSTSGELRGIIPRIIDNIFNYIEIAPESFEFTVRMSYFEIYMEKIRDLLCDGNANLQIHENRERGVYVRHATELYMQSPDEVLDVLEAGALRRSVTETNMNDQSSRSHAVVLLELTQQDTEKGGCKTGKLYLVDLAGSEKVSKTGADGTVLDEAKNINKSLSALGLVIMNLTDGNPKAHIPYRDSKLTRILQESLGGNSRTTIIICASPSSWNEQETLSSLNFGKRAKKIKNKAKINVQYSVQELERQLEDARKEIRKLVKTLSSYEDELEIWRNGGTVSEADRVNLGAAKNIASVSEEKQSQQQAAASVANDAGLSEEERENFMRQESELLDLLDDKDEEIRQLEKEVQSLGEDRVTITKLAGENQSFKELIKTLQEQLDQAQEDCADYEANIEELVATNVTLDEDIERVTSETEELRAALQAAEAETRMQIKAVAEELAALTIGKGGGRQLPKLPNQVKVDPLLEAPLAKARRHIAELAAAEAQAKANESMVSQEKVAELEAELKSKVEYEHLRVEQMTMKLEEAQAANDAIKAKAAAADKKVETLEQQCTELIEKLLESEEKILELEGAMESAASSGQEHVTEVARLKEQQQQIQKEVVDDLQTKLKATKTELESLRADRETLVSQKHDTELELQTVQAERDALRASAEKLKGQLDAASQQESQNRQQQAIIDAKNVRMSSFQDFKKAKWQELLDKQKSSLGNKENDLDASRSGSTSKSKVDEKLREKLEELSKLKADMRSLKTKDMRAETQLTVKERELQKLQRQVLTQTQEIKSLRENGKTLENRLKKVMERRQRGAGGGGRLAGGGARISGGGNRRPTISGGGKSVGASDPRSNVFRAAGRAGTTGSSAGPAAGGAPAADPEQVEYV